MELGIIIFFFKACLFLYIKEKKYIIMASSQSDSSQRTNGMSQRNSFVSLAEEITAMNKNTVEITTKMSDIVSSQDSAVSIAMVDGDGNKSEYHMPTVGYLKKEIDKLNTNIRRLSGIDSTSNIIDGKSIRKVFTVDINKEPYPIGDIGEINKFEPINNSFFESLMNPLLSISLDITDKVNEHVNKILSRRYIVKFERNSDFSLTPDGLTSYNSFRVNFLNKTDIEINEFIDWYDTHLNIGVVRDIVEPYDEQMFDLSVNEVNAHGLFSVIKTETDTLNKKLWYHLNTLNYYTKDGYDKSLTVGDNLILNRLNSSTRWEIKEINTESSNFRVNLERMEGYDPVAIGTNTLSYYSDVSRNKKVKITVGFDEFCVVFIKPIDGESNIISTSWSKGTSFYTNDLILSTDDNTSLADYYLRSVYDYGKLLKDMALKTIPTEYSEKPNVVILDRGNFKVVQINKHLTDTENAKVLRNLHSQKLYSKAKLSQINNAIIEKNKEINTRSFATVADSNTAKNELKKLISEQNVETKSLSSTVAQINTTSVYTSTVSKFRVRGFWNIPQPVYNGKSEPQHIVQFRVQYRYSSKTGEINPTEGFKVKSTLTSEKSDNNGVVVVELPKDTGGLRTTAPTERLVIPYNVNETKKTGGSIAAIMKGNIKSSVARTYDSSSNKKDTTAYFSNWVEFVTDVRKRHWDEDKQIWYWKIEDVEDADTPNINQLDIPIKSNEKVEIRIKSISEVGWPDSLIESEWSDILVVEFPDSLNNVLNENDFILKEASQDETLVMVDNNLNARGVYKHSQDSFYVNDTYYAHMDKGIQSSFKDENGNYINVYNVYEYLNILTNRIKKLEDQIGKARGEFEAYLHTPDDTISISSSSVYNVVVELEDYAERSGTTRTYFNTIGVIDDYYIEIKNVSTNPLSLLSNRLYESTYSNTFFQFENDMALTVDYNNDMYTQFDNQYIWFSDNSDGIRNYSGVTSDAETYKPLQSIGFNIGTVTGMTSLDYYTPVRNIIDDVAWTGTGGNKELFTTVHPRIYNSSDIVESGTEKVKSIPGNGSENIKIHIYYKLDGNSSDDSLYTVESSDLANGPDVRNRRVKVFIEPDTLTKPFEFEIVFILKQFRDVYRSSIAT